MNEKRGEREEEAARRKTKTEGRLKEEGERNCAYTEYSNHRSPSVFTFVSSERSVILTEQKENIGRRKIKEEILPFESKWCIVFKLSEV